MRTILALCAALILMTAPAAGQNSVVIESKSFSIGQSACTVGVFVSNTVAITALSLPLELRQLDAGAFPSANLTFVENPAGRVHSSPLGFGWPRNPPSQWLRRYASPGGTPCSGPVSYSYETESPFDYRSPDALHFMSAGSNCPDEDICPYWLDPGSDPMGTANASYFFCFDLPGTIGRFKIDTCCVRPANHLAFVDMNTELVLPSFTTGIITIESPPLQNSVAIESKSFPQGKAACTVGVFISNNVELTGLTLPFELRERIPGAFPAGNLSFEENRLGRIYYSGLGSEWSPPANITRRYYAVPSGTPCSGPTSRTWGTSAAPDYLSPDAVLFATVWQYACHICWDPLPPGSDFSGSMIPSYFFRFDLSNTPGQFEIDTCCIRPANHLVFVDPNTQPVLPSFTKGIITILPCACPCDAEPVCDGTDDIADVAALIDVAFGGASDMRDPACWATQTDVNADGRTDIVDVVRMIFVAIHNQPREAYFVDPCL